MIYGQRLFHWRHQISSFIPVLLVTVAAFKTPALVPLSVPPATRIAGPICSVHATGKVRDEKNDSLLLKSGVTIFFVLGILCGSCKRDYGVSVLLNKCVTCHNAFGLLIAVLGKLQSVSCRYMYLCNLCQFQCMGGLKCNCYPSL